MQPWIDLLARANPDLPIVLPFMENTDHVTWFGIARDPQTAIRLGQELLAMLGPSYTNFTGLPHVLDAADLSGRRSGKSLCSAGISFSARLIVLPAENPRHGRTLSWRSRTTAGARTPGGPPDRLYS